MPRRQRHGGLKSRRPLLWATLIGTILLLDACGSAPKPKVASLGRHTPVTAAPAVAGSVAAQFTDALKFAHCMQGHRVEDFPDPQNPGGFPTAALAKLATGSSSYISANNACQRLLPNDGQPTPAELEQTITNGLKFAHCMRSHGLRFPDPGLMGDQITINFNDIGDFSSPQYQSAAQECQLQAGT